MRRLLVTTPIFYVNGPPHLGHASSLVLADASARWLRMKGHPVLFTTGTDEHGDKVERAAKHAGQNVAAFCDAVSAQFSSLATALGSSHDRFVRTTEEAHKKTVSLLWRQLAEKGAIKEGSYEGWYSTTDETFVPEKRTREEKNGGGRVSVETGASVEWLAEKTYQLDLSTFSPNIRKWAEANPPPIVPEERRKEVLTQMLTDDSLMAPLSISRSAERSKWGIPVPGDPSQTIYVWLDALANYLTVAKFGEKNNSEFGEIWPPEVQIVGKDILRFHAVIWPAILTALNLELPKKIIAHGHWTSDGQKMSKSVGNVVDPFRLISIFGSDATRYYLLSELNLNSDSNFAEIQMREKVNNDLADTIGNLIRRCTAPSVNKSRVIPNRPNEFCEAGKKLISQMSELEKEVNWAFDRSEMRIGINCISNLARNANRMWEEKKPWQLQHESKRECLAKIVFPTLEAVRVMMTALLPVIPEASGRVLSGMSVPEHFRKAAHLTPLSVPISGASLAPFDSFIFMKKT